MISKLSSWYFSKRALPLWCILILDCCLVLFSDLLVYMLMNGPAYTMEVLKPLSGAFFFYLIFYLLGFRMFHTYSGVIRYSSFIDLQKIALAMLSGLGMTAVMKYVFNSDDWLFPVRMRDLIVSALLATVLMWAMRVIVKVLYDNTFAQSSSRRAMVYGTAHGGVGLAKSIRNNNSRYKLCGFISDGEDMSEHMLMGVKVYHNDARLADVLKREDIDTVLIAPHKNEIIRNNEQMTDMLLRAGVTMMMMPSPKEWDGKSDLDHNQLREVDILDLLPRDEIQIDIDAIGNQLSDRSIMVTGAAGSIGSELVRQLARFRPGRLILIDQAETPLHDIRLMMVRNWPQIEALTIVGDITNKRRMRDLFDRHRPEYVFHTAAYKHVPMMEDNPGESVRNNVQGTRNIADLAVEFGTRKFVMVSTDKAVNPTNVMGCSKRICEIYVQSLDKAIKNGTVKGVTQFVTTRFGNVLGSNGSVIPLFKEQIRKGGPITVTHKDIIRYFMLIPEACKLVLEAGTMGHGGEIYVFDMGKPVRIVDLARRMIDLSGAKDIKIKFIGLRDGEKLYEEVLNKEETTLPTDNPKIKIATVRDYDYEDACRNIEALYESSLKDDDMTIVRHMKEIVPEFKSSHSQYEALDK